MARPRLLLVPELTALEWRIAPLLEDWAEVASFDAPGVGDEPPVETLTRDAIACRGLAEAERRDWRSFVLVADEFGLGNAVAIARMRPQAIEAVAAGHACLSFDAQGERPPIEASCRDAMAQLAQADFRTFVRHLTQVTQGAYDDAMADEYLRRVPQHVCISSFAGERSFDAGPVRRTLTALGVPLLFAEHRDCMMFTREGFEDAAAAFPDARVVTTREKPSASPAFAHALRELCESLVQPVGSLQGDAQPPG